MFPALPDDVLCLTFDDGPGVRLTPALLDLLARHRSRATFFLLGCRAETTPNIVDRIRDEGHELGCHTHNHLHAWKRMPGQIKADIDQGYKALSRWISSDAIFRPPYGKLTPWSRRAIRRRGAQVVRWTVDSGDTWRILPPVESVVEQVQRNRGGVVLLHDFDRAGEDREQRAQFVLEVSEALLDTASDSGWRVSRVGAALGYEPIDGPLSVDNQRVNE